MFDYSYLRTFILTTESLSNYRNYANFLGISTQALYNKMKNKTRFNCEEILKTKEQFKLKDSDIVKMFFTVVK